MPEERIPFHLMKFCMGENQNACSRLFGANQRSRRTVDSSNALLNVYQKPSAGYWAAERPWLLVTVAGSSLEVSLLILVERVRDVQCQHPVVMADIMRTQTSSHGLILDVTSAFFGAVFRRRKSETVATRNACVLRRVMHERTGMYSENLFTWNWWCAISGAHGSEARWTNGVKMATVELIPSAHPHSHCVPYRTSTGGHIFHAPYRYFRHSQNLTSLVSTCSL
ncbi:hypothetical protein BKA93DRAFT_430464 [Sparassis latifolia]